MLLSRIWRTGCIYLICHLKMDEFQYINTHEATPSKTYTWWLMMVSNAKNISSSDRVTISTIRQRTKSVSHFESIFGYENDQISKFWIFREWLVPLRSYIHILWHSNFQTNLYPTLVNEVLSLLPLVGDISPWSLTHTCNGYKNLFPFFSF